MSNLESLSLICTLPVASNAGNIINEMRMPHSLRHCYMKRCREFERFPNLPIKYKKKRLQQNDSFEQKRKRATTADDKKNISE